MSRSTMGLLPRRSVSREILDSAVVTSAKGSKERLTAFSSEGVYYLDHQRNGLLLRRSYYSRRDLANDWTCLRRGIGRKE